MKSHINHLIHNDEPVKNAFEKLNDLGSNAILFLINDQNKLIGSLTDGDLRRGFLKGKNFDSSLEDFVQPNPKKITVSNILVEEIIKYRELNYKIIPLTNADNIVVDIINFNLLKSYLPVDTFIVAGGKGLRLRPLTLNTPKPMLRVGKKPILEHNIDSLIKYGIKNINISVNYLGNQIEEYFGDGSVKNIRINYVKEDTPLGTIGSIKKCDSFTNETIVLMNSDLLTTIDYEKLYLFFINNDADLVVASVPYLVKVPFGVLETSDNEHKIASLVEKPTYTYYLNAGIYIFKKKLIDLIPSNKHFNATDFIEKLMSLNLKVMKYHMTEYWLDIGRIDDFQKAQIDIMNLEYFK